MKTVALEDLVAGVILTFCENVAELGCPEDEKEVDMWFRNLSPKKQRKIADKLLDIIERFAEIQKVWDKAVECPKCGAPINNKKKCDYCKSKV